MALSQWGWTLAPRPGRRAALAASGPRGERRQRARLAVPRPDGSSDPGSLAWLDRARPDRRVLVVTGSPGVGKSAVLGRIVTTADPDIRGVAAAG